MTNEEILKAMHERGAAGYGTAMDLARADEREKITEETVKEYFAGLNGKETALVVLNYLLRGGITDDDLRGLRLQWIKEQPEGVDVWVSMDKGDCFYETHEIWHGSPPTLDRKGYYQGEHGSNVRERLATVLGISKGECAKFRIVRVE